MRRVSGLFSHTATTNTTACAASANARMASASSRVGAIGFSRMMNR